MTTLFLVLYLVGILALIVLGLALLYNLIQLFVWLWKNKYQKTNTGFEGKMINKQRNKILFIVPMMLICYLGIYAYNLPLELKDMLGYEANQISNVQLDHLGNGVPGKSYALEGEEIKALIKFLDSYQYKRSFTASRLGNSVSMLKGTESLHISMNKKDYFNYINMTITNEGYLYLAGNNQAYKVETEDAEVFYNGLIETFRKDEMSVLDKLKAELGRIPEKYDSKAAIEDGCFVVVHSELRSEEKIIQEFASKKRTNISIVQYTIEGDPIITKVAYDRDKYIGVEDNTRDKFAAQIDQRQWEFEYKHLKVYEEKGNVHYYLVDDNELTYEGIMKKLLSSKYEGPNKFKFLCSYQKR